MYQLQKRVKNTLLIAMRQTKSNLYLIFILWIVNTFDLISTTMNNPWNNIHDDDWQ